MAGDKESVLLVYASQTGNAEAVAQELAQETSDRCGMDVRIFCADQVDKKFKLEDEHLSIFVFSTTGDGDPPDNATKLWRKLRRKGDDQTLKSLKYAILGLGDTNYSTFCGAAKGLEKKTADIGGCSVRALGICR
eukprot:comp23207_c0_seq1/m.37710 comp23207_c0_seq1/g.37710  ORF comp23207_c0_seq1/g.37710 comp23207_c0_seq1/m.37710 type:complete len:135 (-) comp23207_c0_seq1:2284-2688(-)